MVYNSIMRIKIDLAAENDVPIPIEYNYNIYLNLRKTLFEYIQPNKPKLSNKYHKKFPNFTFSQLQIPEREVEPGFIRVMGNFLALQVSSADDVFIEYLVKAINTQTFFQIYTHRFPLKKIEILQEPDFSDRMKFKMLSPMMLIQVEDNIPRYVRPDDTDLGDVFSDCLIKAYRLQNGRRWKGEDDTGDINVSSRDIKFQLDQEYVERKSTLTKLYTIRNVHYKTIFSPFFLAGKTELIKFAYHNGIGEKNHYGFGMIETVGR
jgi:CRISPR-associated endoribonuclease Cas6